MDEKDSTQPLNKRDRDAKRVAQIKQYLVNHINSDLRIMTISRKFGLSISAVYHIFKKYQGQSYHQYVESLRMREAFALLQATGARVKEVMYATGYTNRSTFNAAFKRMFGIAPGYFKH